MHHAHDSFSHKRHRHAVRNRDGERETTYSSNERVALARQPGSLYRYDAIPGDLTNPGRGPLSHNGLYTREILSDSFRCVADEGRDVETVVWRYGDTPLAGEEPYVGVFRSREGRNVGRAVSLADGVLLP